MVVARHNHRACLPMMTIVEMFFFHLGKLEMREKYLVANLFEALGHLDGSALQVLIGGFTVNFAASRSGR